MAQKFSFAYFKDIRFIDRKAETRYLHAWLIPVSDSHGHPVAVKLHWERPINDEQKAGWVPVGSFVNGMPRHGCSTLTPVPESFDSDSLPALASAWDSEWRAMYESELAALKSLGCGTTQRSKNPPKQSCGGSISEKRRNYPPAG